MAKKLWGGRFRKRADKDFEEFSKSIHYDHQLAEYDLIHSLAHVAVLKKAGLISSKDASRLTGALKKIKNEVAAGRFRPDRKSEDIHTEIQNRIEKKAGKIAGKLHTLRSRNDQIVFDEKMYCRAQAVLIESLLKQAKGSLSYLSRRYKARPFPGYTHTQRAQVISFKSYLDAFSFMFQRDLDKVGAFLEGLVVYIGSGALAGTSLSRKDYAAALRKVLGKSSGVKVKVLESPLDNVSSRDFIIEFLGILSVIQMHLSRLAEDLILYSTKEFNLLDLPEQFCTGSSLMPQKKNPDFLELVRGNTGKVYGSLVSILTTMKSLPLSYNRDMQFDKEPLFSSVDIVKNELKIMVKFLRGLRLKEKNVARALEDEGLYATELAEHLVLGGLDFSQAHLLVGKLIRYAEEKGMKIKEMPDKFLKAFHPSLNQKVVSKLMDPRKVLGSRNHGLL